MRLVKNACALAMEISLVCSSFGITACADEFDEDYLNAGYGFDITPVAAEYCSNVAEMDMEFLESTYDSELCINYKYSIDWEVPSLSSAVGMITGLDDYGSVSCVMGKAYNGDRVMLELQLEADNAFSYDEDITISPYNRTNEYLYFLGFNANSVSEKEYLGYSLGFIADPGEYVVKIDNNTSETISVTGTYTIVADTDESYIYYDTSIGAWTVDGEVTVSKTDINNDGITLVWDFIKNGWYEIDNSYMTRLGTYISYDGDDEEMIAFYAPPTNTEETVPDPSGSTEPTDEAGEEIPLETSSPKTGGNSVLSLITVCGAAFTALLITKKRI